MKKLRIAQAALATILATGISSTSYAFMAVPVDQPAEVQMSLSQTVDALRNEIALGQTSCEDMLVKLDAFLDDIDNKLDEGVPNESEYLAARDEVSKMRYDLECIGTDLTQQIIGPDGNPVPPGLDGGLGAGGFTPNAPAGGAQGFSGGGIAGGGGSSGGGGSFASGGAFSTFGLAGGTLGAIASDNNNAGFIASQSSSN